MSKELEELEILKFLVNNYGNFEFDFSIIETALKRLELIDKISPYAVNYDFETLDKKITALSIKADEKDDKIKALEIIKEKGVNIRLLKETDNAMEYNELIKSHYGMLSLSTEEYDLLKEVLL